MMTPLRRIQVESLHTAKRRSSAKIHAGAWDYEKNARCRA